MESAQPAITSLRIALIGDSNVGKRTYIHKLAKMQNQQLSSHQNILPYPGLTNIHLQSNLGSCQVTFVLLNININDFKANQVYRQQLSSIIKTCDTVFFMFSLIDRQSYKSIPQYFRIWIQTKQNGFGVLLSTQADQKILKIKQKQIMYHRKKNLQFYNISTKAGYNILRPIQYLFKRTLGRNDFQFKNAQKFIDFTQQVQFPNKQQLEKQMKEISFLPLPSDDDENDY